MLYYATTPLILIKSRGLFLVQIAVFDANASRHSSEALLWVVGRLVMSHRSISYRGMADTATGDSRYCDG